MVIAYFSDTVDPPLTGHTERDSVFTLAALLARPRPPEGGPRAGRGPPPGAVPGRSGREDAVQEVPVAAQRQPQPLGVGVLPAARAVRQRPAVLGDRAAEGLDGLGGEVVRLAHGLAGVGDERGLHLAPALPEPLGLGGVEQPVRAAGRRPRDRK